MAEGWLYSATSEPKIWHKHSFSLFPLHIHHFHYSLDVENCNLVRALIIHGINEFLSLLGLATHCQGIEYYMMHNYFPHRGRKKKHKNTRISQLLMKDVSRVIFSEIKILFSFAYKEKNRLPHHGTPNVFTTQRKSYWNNKNCLTLPIMEGDNVIGSMAHTLSKTD